MEHRPKAYLPVVLILLAAYVIFMVHEDLGPTPLLQKWLVLPQNDACECRNDKGIGIMASSPQSLDFSANITQQAVDPEPAGGNLGPTGLSKKEVDNDIIVSESFSRGVMYFAYSHSPDKIKQYIKNSANSLSSVRMFNKTIRAALATNGYVNQSELREMGFSDLVRIDNKDVLPGKKQWWTRTLYLNKSPYDQTIQVGRQSGPLLQPLL